MKNKKTSSLASSPPDAEQWRSVDVTWLAPSTAPGPAFPIDALPEHSRSLVDEFVAARHLNVDFLAGALIGAASAAIGNRARLIGFDGRAQPLSLFIAIIGWPATGKSEVLALAEEPLARIEDALHAAFTAQGSGSGRLSTLAASFAATAARRLSYEGIAPDTDTDDENASQPGLLLSEFSAAGLLDELRSGIDGRALIVDELTGALAGSSGQAGLRSRALLLQAFDGKPYRKRTATAGLVTIPALQIAILGGTQPDRVPAIVGRARDGLVPRFLWIAPEVEPHATLPSGSGPMDAWQAALARLVRIPPAADESGYAHPIPLGESARGPMEAAAHHWVADQKRSDPTERDVIARARQQAMRLSAVIALLEHALTEREGAVEEVTGADVERGIVLMDQYFLPMAARTFALAGAPRESDALRLARHLKRLGRPTLSVRDDITRGAGSPVRNAAAVAEAIAELKARGLVREAPREPGALGRPGIMLAVHPALLTA